MAHGESGCAGSPYAGVVKEFVVYTGLRLLMFAESDTRSQTPMTMAKVATSISSRNAV